jgi:hypothetical protein
MKPFFLFLLAVHVAGVLSWRAKLLRYFDCHSLLWAVFLVILYARMILPTNIQSSHSQKIERLPFQKENATIESPENYAKRIRGTDAKTGKPVYYDPMPRVDLLDRKSGKYILRWIGYSGKEFKLIYQRPDGIDATISALATKSRPDQYSYVYKIKNLPVSGQFLSGFALQYFSSNIKPFAIGDGYVGPMTKGLFKREGNWVFYGANNFNDGIYPGQSVELKAISTSPPGLVECRIQGGTRGMIGEVEEEPPQELENVILGYEAWPRSFTIGPIDDLKGISQSEKISYLLKSLPQCHRQGWITVRTMRTYEQLSKQNNLQGIISRIESDLKADSITTEVFAIIDGMKN